MATMATTTEIGALIDEAVRAARAVQDAIRPVKRPDLASLYRVRADVLVEYEGRAETGEAIEDTKWVSPGRVKPGHRPIAVRLRDTEGFESDALWDAGEVAEIVAEWTAFLGNIR